MDDYLDSFLILALDAGYTDPQTLVVKFRRGLKLNVQSQIATMPFGQPADTDPEAWYAAARRIVRTKGINTRSISRPIPVYNVDGSPNEAGQISEVVDVVLHYKTHSERTLLAVSSLGKQNMILGYTWLKDHNLEVNWQTGEVQMNRCPP